MMISPTKLWLAILAAAPLCVSAVVNPVDQTLTENHIDFEGRTVTVTRNFHSSRASSGMFGKGWCSMWETKLTVSNTGAEFNLCGDGNIVRFSKAQNWKATDPAYQLQTKGKTMEVTAGFRNRYLFDKDGRLTEAQLDDKAYTLTYAGKHLKSISGGGEKVEFQFSGHRVSEFKSSTGVSITYLYEGDYLKRVAASGRILYEYTHNKHGQLIEVNVAGRKREYSYSGKGVERIEFGRCKEDISVRSAKAEKTVTVEKNCGGKKEIKTFTVNGTNRANALKLKTVEPGKTTEREWKNGRLVAERGPAGVLKYEYDKYGAIKNLTMPGWKLMVNERASGFPRRVTIQTPVVGSQSVSLTWNQGRLASFQSKAMSFQLKESAQQTMFSGPQFNLSMATKGGDTWLSGSMANQKIAPFKTGGDIYKYQAAQLDALGLMTSLTFLKDRLESL